MFPLSLFSICSSYTFIHVKCKDIFLCMPWCHIEYCLQGVRRMSIQNRFPYNKHWHCMAYGFFFVVRRLLVPCCLSLFYSFDAWTCFFFSFSYIQRRRKGKEILRIFHKMLNYISSYIDLLVLMPNNSYQHVIVVAQIDSIVAFFWKALLLFVKRCFVWIIIYFQYFIKFRRKTSYCIWKENVLFQ